MVAALLGLGAGILLAQYFQALILVPATVLALAGSALIESFNGHNLFRALLTSLCVALALQLGFVCWVLIRAFIQAAYAPEADSEFSDGREPALHGEFRSRQH